MKLSLFGEKLTNGSGIVDLMQDLGSALNENPNMIFMGGGNPARIPEMEAVFKTQYKKLIESSEQLYSTTGVYQSPQGEQGFRRDIASMLKQAVRLATDGVEYRCFQWQSVGFLYFI